MSLFRAKSVVGCLALAGLLFSCSTELQPEKTSDPYVEIGSLRGDPELSKQVAAIFDSHHIHCLMFGSTGYSIVVPLSESTKATEVLREAKEKYGYDWLQVNPFPATNPS